MIKKQFDLETWQNNKNFVEVITEYAEPVEIVKWDCRGKYPILALVYDGDTDDACFYTIDGVSAGGSRLILLIADEKKYNSRKRLRFMGRAGIIVTVLLGLALVCSVLVKFISSGVVLGIICSGMLVLGGGFVLVLYTLDFIKEEKKRL